jgi:hypothetical protein
VYLCRMFRQARNRASSDRAKARYRSHDPMSASAPVPPG